MDIESGSSATPKTKITTDTIAHANSQMSGDIIYLPSLARILIFPRNAGRIFFANYGHNPLYFKTLKL